jgi:TfoX N-terminal domain
MAYDEALGGRIRALLDGEPALTEQKMFGGLAFLIGGNMAVSASRQGGALVHVDPEEGEQLIATTAAQPMEMRGRRMRGWLRVDSAQLLSEGELARWVELGAAHARSLPTK